MVADDQQCAGLRHGGGEEAEQRFARFFGQVHELRGDEVVGGWLGAFPGEEVLVEPVDAPVRFVIQSELVANEELPVMKADPRVTAHLDKAGIQKLLDPTAYTGLCAQMAHDAATRARATAKQIRDG